MVEIKHLSKHYGNVLAVDDISFVANPGEILGLLGPNGAGKSTTLNIITGYLSSSEGSVIVEGYDILEQPKKAKSKIGYLPEQPPLYQEMTVRNYLEFLFDLKKVRLPKKEHIDEVMTIVKLRDVEKRIIRNLSKGYRQRVGLAGALIGNPPVLINKGQIVADSPIYKLSEVISGPGMLTLEIEGGVGTVKNALGSVDGVRRVTHHSGNSYTVSFDTDTDVRRGVFKALARADCPILSMTTGGLTLEESFLKLTEGGDD